MALATQDADPAPHEHSAARYSLVYAILLVLTATTYWTGRHVDMGGHLNLFVALAIAITKATLVVLFFMHLIDHKGTSAMVFSVSILFVMLLMGMVVTDNATRFPLSNPPESTPELKRNVPPPRAGDVNAGTQWRSGYAD